MFEFLTKWRMRRALARLGDSADAVAQTLRDEGITGYRSESMACPVAKYLEGRGFREVCVGEREAWTGYTRVETPRPVGSFIVRFDTEDAYRDLRVTVSGMGGVRTRAVLGHSAAGGEAIAPRVRPDMHPAGHVLVAA